MPIDYERMNRTVSKHKAALTRAKKQGYTAVLTACRAAVHEWVAIGAWPDNWAVWDVALRDAACTEARRNGHWPMITNLDEL